MSESTYRLGKLEIAPGDVLVVRHRMTADKDELIRMAERWHIWGQKHHVAVAIVPPGADLSVCPFQMLEKIYFDAKAKIDAEAAKRAGQNPGGNANGA